MHFSRPALVGYRTPEKRAVVLNNRLKAEEALSEFDYIISRAFFVIRYCEISIIIVVYFCCYSKSHQNCQLLQRLSPEIEAMIHHTCSGVKEANCSVSPRANAGCFTAITTDYEVIIAKTNNTYEKH